MNRERPIDSKTDDLDLEHRYIQSTGKQIRRISMNRGDSFLVRFLPAEMGPKKHWYARIAKHWINQKPTVCPRHTGADYGGDPDAVCPVCEEVASLDANHEDDAVRNEAFRARANPQWITWCLLLDKGSGGGSITQSDLLLPYSFELYKNTFEELSSFFRNNRRKNPMSVLDLVHGCDFWAAKTAKGIRLDKQEPQPILDNLTEDPMLDPRIVKIMEQLKAPRVHIPDEDQLEEAADKLREFALKPITQRGRGRGRGSEGGRSSRQSHPEDEVEDTDNQDDGSQSDPAPRRPRTAPMDETEDVSPAEPATPPRRRQPAAESTPPPPLRRSAPPEPPRGRTQDVEEDDAPSVEPAQSEEDEADVHVHRSVTRTPAPQRGATQSPARPSAPMSPAASATLAARSSPPPAPSNRRRSSDAKIDENEELPEERTDRAPAAPRALHDVNEPPAQVQRPGGTPPSTPVVNERLRARIQAAKDGLKTPPPQ